MLKTGDLNGELTNNKTQLMSESIVTATDESETVVNPSPLYISQPTSFVRKTLLF